MTNHEITDTHGLAESSSSSPSGDAATGVRRPGPIAVVGLAVAGTMSSVAVAGVAFADRGGDWGYRGDGRHWWGVGGFLLLLAVAAAVAALTALLLSRRPAFAGGSSPRFDPTPPAASGAPSAATFAGPLAGAESILAERLARGEIGPDDYRASLAALRDQIPPSPTGAPTGASPVSDPPTVSEPPAV